MPTGKAVLRPAAAAVPAVVAALLLTGGCGQGGSGSAGDACPQSGTAASAAASATSHLSSDDPSAVASYWTDDRMRSARPAPMPTKDGRGCAS